MNPIVSHKRFIRFKFLPALLLAGCLLVAACDLLPAAQVAGRQTGGTPVPTPTRDPSGYQAIESPACQLASWTTMQVNPKQPQGNLIAWQPPAGSAEADERPANLAFIAPIERTAWYTGELMLALGPDYTELIALAPGRLTAGDLTWSPSGEWLAFVAYRQNEGLFTVMAVRPDGSELTDLFPLDLARTDARTSRKAIIGWKDDRTLEVLSSCGEECRNAYDVRVSFSGAAELVPTPIASYHDLTENLQITSNTREYPADQYPKGMRTPNWSADATQAVYLDKRGMLWALSVPSKTTFMFDIGLRDIYESHWSTDGRQVAVRAEDKVFLYELSCSSAR